MCYRQSKRNLKKSRAIIVHLICKIHHDEAQRINEAELMLNDPLKWHSPHQEVDSSASE